MLGGLNLLACALALSGLATGLSPAAWSWFFFAHFLALILGGMGLLAWRFSRGEIDYRALSEHLVAIGCYVLALSLAGAWARSRPQAGLIPGLWLLAYGWGLWRGRRFGFF